MIVGTEYLVIKVPKKIEGQDENGFLDIIYQTQLLKSELNINLNLTHEGVSGEPGAHHDDVNRGEEVVEGGNVILEKN